MYPLTRVWYVVTMTKEEEAALMKLVLNNHKLLTPLSEFVGDIAIILNEIIPRCQAFECTEHATMKNVAENRLLCGRHCAEQVMVEGDEHVERDWLELPHAESIVQVEKYVDLVKKLTATKENSQ